MATRSSSTAELEKSLSSEVLKKDGGRTYFCIGVRAEIAEGRSEKDEQNEIAKDSSALIRRRSLR
jgi:hypothetical protein